MRINLNILATKDHRKHKEPSAYFAFFRGQLLPSLRSILLCLAMLTAGCEKVTLPEGDFAAKAVLSDETMHVGDVVSLTLTARHAPGSTVEFPPIGNRKEIVVRGRATETTVPAEGMLETEEVVRLTSLRTGNWLVTTNPVICTFSDGTKKTQQLPSLSIKVDSTLNEENASNLSDIKGPVKNLKLVLWVVLLILVVAVLVGVITLRVVKRPKAVEKSAPPVPPHVTAKESLAALRNEPWKPEPFFVKLSLILRTYLEGRFEMNAPELTTEELTRKLPHEHKKTLEPFFEQSDLVKFARADAQQEVMQTAFTTVETFVDQTMQGECLPQESAENSKTKEGNNDKFNRFTPLSQTISLLLTFVPFALFRG